MKERCFNPKIKAYKNYGARGIKVCDRWIKFENFLADMGEMPEGLTLERIDNEKGYFPGNTKWGTRKEQAGNTRNNKFFEFNGIAHILPDWSRITGIARSTIDGRIRGGWSIEEALTIKPVIGRNQYHD